MRKAIHERKTALRLDKVGDEMDGVLPYVKMSGDKHGVRFRVKFEGPDESWGGGFEMSDPDAIREVRDQLDAWLEEHE